MLTRYLSSRFVPSRQERISHPSHASSNTRPFRFRHGRAADAAEG